MSMLTLALAAALVLPAAALAPARAADGGVKFVLKVDRSESSVVDVTLNFNMEQGEKVVIRPPSSPDEGAPSAPVPEIEMAPSANNAYVVEALSPEGSGWLVTAAGAGEVSVAYAVRFQGNNSPRKDPEAPGGVAPPTAVSEPDLKLFKGSDVFLCPRTEGGKFISTEFLVEVPLASGEDALSPWAPVSGKDGSFEVSGVRALLDNFVSWGELEIERFKTGGTEVIAGFSSDRSKQSASERQAEINALKALFGDLAETLGERRELDTLSVLLCGAERFGLDEPAAETLLQSAVVMSDADTLSDMDAVAAAGGLFELWNRYALVPEPGADSRWFQAGLSLFYPLRLAAFGGLLASDDAYEEFSRTYRAYLTDPMALEVSLEEAESDPDAQALLANKGAAVTASVARKLPEESEGKVRDIDWLLGRLIERRDAFDGREYSLVDISELAEGATGKSWDRYFEGRVRGTTNVLTSEFSVSDLFGSSTGFTRGVVTGGGSGRNWIYLLVAIFVIMLIPVVMSPYVRRSVKLDITMPKILPDDDDDE